MRILVIGGNGFIGSPLVSELLGSEHEVAVFHRCSDVGLSDSGVVQIQGTGIGCLIAKVSCADFLPTSSSI
jgi:nucleoside-diphosphate-sugar epimerase